MAYQVSRVNDEVKAIAVIGGPTDQFQSCRDRPALYHRVLKPLIGDTMNFRKEYIRRSAIFWAHEINEPTLILHGENDSRVNLFHATKLASLMKENGNIVSLHVFREGDHSLRLSSQMEERRDSIILDWFNQHLK